MADITFKSAMSGFNKQEVLAYIGALTKEKDGKITELTNRMKELERIISNQNTTISQKDSAISNLHLDVEKAQVSEGNKYKEIAELMEKVSKSEQDLQDTVKQMESDYNAKLSKKGEEIVGLQSDNKKYIDDLSNKQREIDDAKCEIGSLKVELDEKNNEIVSVRDELNQSLEDIKREYEAKLVMTGNSNKEELTQIRESLQATKAIEESAKQRANDLVDETREKCNNMVRKANEEIEQKRHAILSEIEQEAENKRVQTKELQQRLDVIVNIINENKTRFVQECDRITLELRNN